MKYVDSHCRRFLSLFMCLLLLVPILTPVMAADSFEASLSAFPQSYWDSLRALHQAHPTWTFRAVNTNLDWNSAVTNESEGTRSLIYGVTYGSLVGLPYLDKSSSSYNPATNTYISRDGYPWYKTTPLAVSFFMDPRNFLTERYIFQFQDLHYNSLESKNGIERIFSGTYWYNRNASYVDSSGTNHPVSETYSDLILGAAKKYNVSAYYLASKMLLESGSSLSNNTNGKDERCPGCYNFFNIDAWSHDGRDATYNGLLSAKRRGWISPKLSIYGGAEFLAEDYISQNQHTGYYIRFNVAPNSKYPRYTHQYMTNISGAATEASETYSAYSQLNLLDQNLVFEIPVFSNMSDTENQIRCNIHSDTWKTTSSVNVRTGPGMSPYSVQDTLSSGTSVTVLESTPTDLKKTSSINNQLVYPVWQKIQYKQNGVLKTGYLSSRYTVPTATRSLTKGSTLRLSPTSTKRVSGETYYYESEDYRIAEISTYGLLTAKSTGTTRINVYSSNGSMDSFFLTVTTGKAVTGTLYPDVYTSDWFYDDVKYTTDNGLFLGFNDGSFRPHDETTRAQFVTILYRAAGSPSVSFNNVFSDVKSTSWFADAVSWASREGIVDGYGNGKFGPNNAITREQITAILYRYAAKLGKSTSGNVSSLNGFADSSSVSSWAKESMAWAVDHQIINGSSGNLLPRNNATRCQIAAIIHRFQIKF